MKKVTPFSNGTEAMSWLYNNCDQCKRWQCSAKKALQLGFITGEITELRANYIGYTMKDNDFYSLFPKCGEFIDTPVVRKKKEVIDNNLILF